MTQTLDRTARRTQTFTESVIREMTRVAREHDALNLAQGFPDFPAPEILKEAAAAAIRADVNQYAITWGAQSLRQALARKYGELYGMDVDAEREITVTCGATEAMAAVMLSVIDPGAEVVVLEPFYENYGPDTVLSDAKPVFLTLDPPDYRLEMILKKPLKATVERLELSVGKFIHFHGSGIRNDQVDISRGAQRDVVKGKKVYADTSAGISLAKALPGLARAAGLSD